MQENLSIWPDWELQEQLDSGSCGVVYRACHRNHPELQSAVKLLFLPESEEEADTLRGRGLSDEQIRQRYLKAAEAYTAEMRRMELFKGTSHIVSVEDFSTIPQENGIGWDLYIKMELLTPMLKSLQAEPTEEEVIRIGIDIAGALAACRKRNIIHRDIKPQNMFVSEDGNYKLGDFGVAKTAERVATGTKTGTFKFMAPEVYNNRPYGHGVDIYSLGMVLHWLLNERRSPFLPMPPAVPKASDEDSARERRFRGEPVPAPAHGSAGLKAIVCKCVAFDPAYRYETPEQLQDALRALLSGEPAQTAPAKPEQTGQPSATETQFRPAGPVTQDPATFRPVAPQWKPQPGFQPVPGSGFRPAQPSVNGTFQPAQTAGSFQPGAFQPQASNSAKPAQTAGSFQPGQIPANNTFKPAQPTGNGSFQPMQPGGNTSFQPMQPGTNGGYQPAQSAAPGQNQAPGGQMPIAIRLAPAQAAQGAVITLMGPENKQYFVQIPGGTVHGQMLWAFGRTRTGEVHQFHIRVFLG